MSYKLLEWQGPFRFHDIDKLPDAPGLYLITNSTSPFAVDVHRNNSSPSSPFTELPAILYGGMTTSSLRHRLKVHENNKTFSVSTDINLENVYLYVATSSDPAHFEKEMITELKPLLNHVVFSAKLIAV